MIHPCTEVRFIDSEKGYGLFATQPIPKGTITWVRDSLDREISPEVLLTHSKEIQEVIIHYSYRNNKGNYIFCWDNTRYVNHDSHPNTCITAYDVEIAIRDIGRGEEITNHYGMLNIIEPFTLHGETDVTIYPDDLLRLGAHWDEELADAFKQLALVDQPLRHLVSDSRWETLSEICRGVQPMKSVSSCYFAGYVS